MSTVKCGILALCVVLGSALFLGAFIVATSLPARPAAAKSAPAAKRKPPALAKRSREPERTPPQQAPVAAEDPPVPAPQPHQAEPVKLPPSKVTRANYARLERTMALTDVERILGPGKELSRGAGGSLNMEWRDPARHVLILITFRGASDGHEPLLLGKSISD